MTQPMAVTAGSGGILNDRHDFLVVNDWARHTGWLHGAATLYAGKGIVGFALLVLAGWWVARRSGDHRRVAAALWAGIGTLVTVAVNQPISHAVRRDRPYVTLHHTLLLVHRSTDYSFPSDHACMAGAVAAGLFLVSRRLGVVAAVAAVLMAFARVYVGAHYPGDVIAGLALGAAVVGVGHVLAVPLLGRVVDHAVHTPLRGLFVTSRRVGTRPAATGGPRSLADSAR
jgi:membrane-associated phospholipid phosphatase